MFRIADGREFFYQWDLNVKLSVTGAVTRVHFERIGFKEALGVDVETDGDIKSAKVPNIMLQKPGQIKVYAYIQQDDSSYTKCEKIFNIKEAPKPPNYVYTETEVVTFEALVEKTDKAAQNANLVAEDLIQKRDSGCFNGKDAHGFDYAEVNGNGNLIINYVDGTTKDAGHVVGEKGDKGDKGEPGYTPQKGADYCTEAEKKQLIAEVNEHFKVTKNLFSFENADENFARFATNETAKQNNYIYQQKAEFGYKDVENNYFVYNGGNVHHGITGGLELPLLAGSYKITAEVYIPSGNTTRTSVTFGAYVAPSLEDYVEIYDIGVQDTWVEIEKTIPVAEGDTAVYIYTTCYIDPYPYYIRNIKVTQINPWSSSWEGKKWVVVGDSITQKTNKSLKNYFDYISEKTGIMVHNMGVGGSGYKKMETEKAGQNAFYQKILEVPTDADVVTILGSGNDLEFGYELGEVTDTGTDTICGCINTTIDNLYSILPDVNLGIITPNPWGKFKPLDDTNEMAQYSAKIVEICRLRGIPCLDLYHCSGMRPWDATFLEIAYPINSAGTGRDTIHPNEVGHSILAPKIKAFLESLIM